MNCSDCSRPSWQPVCYACQINSDRAHGTSETFTTHRYGKWVPCPGCIKRKVQPVNVKRGTQCNQCADIEEGKYVF